MIPLAIQQVFFKQIKAKTGCDKVLMECSEEFIFVTLIKLSGGEMQQLKKVFRWQAINPSTLGRMAEEFNRLYPPTNEQHPTDED